MLRDLPAPLGAASATRKHITNSDNILGHRRLRRSALAVFLIHLNRQRLPQPSYSILPAIVDTHLHCAWLRIDKFSQSVECKVFSPDTALEVKLARLD
jgi:hypothetical protein